MDQFPVTVPNPAVATQGPYRPIRPGESVEISSVPANAGNSVFFNAGGVRTAAINGPREELASTSVPRPVTVRNLNQIWIYGVAGVSALLTVLEERGSSRQFDFRNQPISIDRPSRPPRG